MKHIGLDVHKKTTNVCWIDEQTGVVSGQSKVLTEQVVATVGALPGEKWVALETGSQSWFLARQLQSLPDTEVFVVDAFRGHRALEGMKRGRKNDKLDARGLARLSLEGRTPAMAVWLVDQAGHDLRTLTRTYITLVRQSTVLRNRIRSLLAAQGLSCEASDLTAPRAQGQLQQLRAQLPLQVQFCLESLNDALLCISKQVERCRARVEQACEQHAQCQQLQSIGGCGPILSTLVMAELADYQRFTHCGALRCYAGLTASIDDTGERSRYGRLVKGNSYLKYALVMLAQHMASHKDFEGTAMRRRYYRCLFKHDRTVANIDLARQLCDLIYAMLRDGTDYKPKKLEP